MSDFSSIFMPPSQQRFNSPKEEKAHEHNRLMLLCQATATQALMNAARKRLAAILLGFLIIPTIFFQLAASLTSAAEGSIEYGVFGLAGYAVGGIIAYLFARLFVDADPDEELEKIMPRMLKIDDEFRKKWGEPKRKTSVSNDWNAPPRKLSRVLSWVSCGRRARRTS